MTESGDRLFEQLMRLKPHDLTANGWAVKAGVSRTIWSDLKRHGNPSRRTLERLLAAAGSSLAEFEALRVDQSAPLPVLAGKLAESGQHWGQAPLAPLPLLATAPGGRWSKHPSGIPLLVIDRGVVVDRLARPHSLAGDRDAYAVTIVCESMWPRFRSGRRVAVSPAATVVIGDDALVILKDGGALLGELRSRNPQAFGLRQFNPSIECQVAAGDVEAVHKVMGELI